MFSNHPRLIRRLWALGYWSVALVVSVLTNLLFAKMVPLNGADTAEFSSASPDTVTPLTFQSAWQQCQPAIERRFPNQPISHIDRYNSRQSGTDFHLFAELALGEVVLCSIAADRTVNIESLDRGDAAPFRLLGDDS